MEGLDLKQFPEMVRLIAEEKGLSEETVLGVVETAIAAAWRRDHGEHDMDVRATLNLNSGEADVYVARTVVEDGVAYNPDTEIPQAEAGVDKAIGDVVEEKHQVTSFGRVAAQTAKQVVLQRLREAEREAVLSEFADKIGTVVTGTVARVESRVVRIDVGKVSGIMPRSEQKAIMDYLLPKVYAEVPEWMQNTRLKGLSGNNGDQTMTIGMQMMSQFVTSPNLLDRLLQTEQLQGSKAYSAAELYAAVNKAVFNNFSTTTPINRVNTRAQYLFMEAFVNNYVAADVLKNMGTPVSGFMISQMKQTLNSIERLSKTHATAAGRAHYRGLYIHTKHLLTQTEKKIQEKNAKKGAARLVNLQYNGMCNGTWQ